THPVTALLLSELYPPPPPAPVPYTAPVRSEVLYSFTASATDADNTNQTLSFSLTGDVPTGAAIGETSGVFTWTPTEAQGADDYSFAEHATDGQPRDELVISITLEEWNGAPV